MAAIFQVVNSTLQQL